MSSRVVVGTLVLAQCWATTVGEEFVEAVAPTDCVGEACLAEPEPDLTEFIQRRLQKDAQIRPTPNKIWATFEGGGFRALGSHTGIVAGLLAAKPDKKLGEEDGLFSRVDNLASNSGGSWFSSLLSYSPKFQAMVEQTAITPGNQSYWFDEYYWPFLMKLGSVEYQPLLTASQLDGIHAASLEGLIEACIEILTTLIFADTHNPPTWQDFVDKLFEAGGGDRSVQMGAQVNPWARNKVWGPAVSVNSLGGSGPGTCDDHPFIGPDICALGFFTSETIATGPEGKTKLAYKAMPGRGLPSDMIPAFLPGSITVRHGSGLGSRAVAPFVAPRFGSMSFHYENQGNLSTTHANSARVGNWPQFTEDTGKLPVTSVVASSSAAFGGIVPFAGDTSALARFVAYILEPLTSIFGPVVEILSTFFQHILNAEWAMWVTQKGGSDTFKEGSNWWKKLQNSHPPKGEFHRLAGDGLFSLVDGGYGDNSAIAVAVGQGATEVTAFLDYLDITGPLSDFFGLFDGGAGASTLTKIFQENAYAMRDEWKSQASSLQVVAGATTLTGIQVWSQVVMTADNPWFSVVGGRSVTLNVIFVNSTAALAFDYKRQSALISEVAQTVSDPANSAEADTMWSWLAK